MYRIIRDNLISPQRIVFIFLILIITYLWWTISREIDLKIAWGGFSPIGWVCKSFMPDNFVRDFPQGDEDYDKSAFMHIYKIAHSYLGIPPETLLPIIIFFEIAFLSYAIYILTRTLFPTSSHIVAFLTVVVTLFSYSSYMELARFRLIFFEGQYYAVADALRFLAIAMFLKNRPTFSFLLLAGSFVTHPIKGIIAFCFILATYLFNPKGIITKNALKGIAIFLVICIGWLLLTFNMTNFSETSIPKKLWFELTKLNCFHWYPVDYGLFSQYHEERFIPFLSFILLLTYYIRQTKGFRDMDKKVIAGVLVSIILIITGILFSVLDVSTTLVKLSLHRASELVIMIGLIYIIHGLWSEMESKQLWRKIIAASILISPFILKPGFPLLYSILLTSPTWGSIIKKEKRDIGKWIVTVLSIGSIILIGIYAIAGMSGKWTSAAYTGFGSRLFIYTALLFGLLFIFIAVLKRYNIKTWATQLVVLLLITGLALNWAKQQVMSSKQVRLASDYKQVQLWARDNTPRDALFMQDPTIYYGWRDYSQRSSFGNLREWLATSWMYNSDANAFYEGMKRFNEFDIDINKYIYPKPNIHKFPIFSRAVKERFYSLGDEWRLDLVKRYGIDYFVMEKNEMKTSSQMLTAYENEHFIVLSVSPAN